jgi:hypothetical protein
MSEMGHQAKNTTRANRVRITPVTRPFFACSRNFAEDGPLPDIEKLTSRTEPGRLNASQAAPFTSRGIAERRATPIYVRSVCPAGFLRRFDIAKGEQQRHVIDDLQRAAEDQRQGEE